LTFVCVKKKPNKKFLKILGKHIRELREKQGISQSQLGFETGLHRDQIGRIELGKQNTSITNIEAIASALEISLKDLVDFEY